MLRWDGLKGLHKFYFQYRLHCSDFKQRLFGHILIGFNNHIGHRIFLLPKYLHCSNIHLVVHQYTGNFMNLLAQMEENWRVMKESIATGIQRPGRSKGGLIGGDGRKLYDYCHSDAELLAGANVMEAVSYALAVAEGNAAMGRIVAFSDAFY